MPNEQLVDYIRTESAKGATRESMMQALSANGWQASDIEAGFASVGTASMQTPVSPMSTMNTSTTASESQPAGEKKYAGFWVRLAASVIDGIVLGIIGFPIKLLVSNQAAAGGASVIVGWIVMILLISKFQASPGKMAVGLHIEKAEGERVGLGTAFMREIVGKLVSGVTLGIGYLMVAWTKQKRGLHDYIAGTVVVENDPTKSKTGWVVFGVICGVIIPVAIVGLIMMFGFLFMSALGGAVKQAPTNYVSPQGSSFQINSNTAK